MDETVWTEVMRLLEDPTLIQQELERRLAVTRAADPTTQRERTVQRDLVRVGKTIERMPTLTAYQEDLLSLEQLREWVPLLRQREQALRTELKAIVEQTRERATYLSLARPSRRLSADCARPPIHSTFLSGSESCAWSSRKSSLPMTRSLSATAFLFHRDRRTGAAGRRIPPRASRIIKVTFCVRGVASPLLANFYLRYVFDLRVQARRRKQARGGEQQRRGRILRTAHPHVQSLLVQAAWRMSRSSSPDTAGLRTWAQAIARRRGKKVAMVALAQRLARILFAMWRDEADYQPHRLREKQSRPAAFSTAREATAVVKGYDRRGRQAGGPSARVALGRK